MCWIKTLRAETLHSRSDMRPIMKIARSPIYHDANVVDSVLLRPSNVQRSGAEGTLETGCRDSISNIF